MQYIVGQLLGIAATVITVAIPVFRKKWQMLAATLSGNLLMAIHFFLIRQIGSAIFLYFVAMLQAIVSMCHTVKQTQVRLWEQFLFCAMYIGLGVFGIVTAPGFVPKVNAVNLLELVPVIASAMLTFSIFARSEQTTRIFLLINTSLWAAYGHYWVHRFFCRGVHCINHAFRSVEISQKRDILRMSLFCIC